MVYIWIILLLLEISHHLWHDDVWNETISSSLWLYLKTNIFRRCLTLISFRVYNEDFSKLESWTKYFETFSGFSKVSPRLKWNGTKLLSPKKLHVSDASCVAERSRLKILGRKKNSRKFLKCLKLKTSARRAFNDKIFNTFPRKLQKHNSRTLYSKIYFT